MVIKVSSVLAAAGAAVLGFVGVAAVGVLLRSQGRVDDRTAASLEAGRATDPGRSCDRRARLDDLRRIEAKLTSRVDELTAADATARFLPPRDVPIRFSGTAVRTAVETAIGASGVGGRVDEVDCSAFPCLAIAHFARGELLGKLQRELRRSPEYADDIALVTKMGDDPAGGGALVGAIVFPRNEPRAAEILAAFKRRRAEAVARWIPERG